MNTTPRTERRLTGPIVLGGCAALVALFLLFMMLAFFAFLFADPAGNAARLGELAHTINRDSPIFWKSVEVWAHHAIDVVTGH